MRMSSTVARRSVEMHRPSSSGEARLIASGSSGAESVAPTRSESSVDAAEQRPHAHSSTRPTRSRLMSAAAATVQRMSVPCSSRCVEVGSSISPDHKMGKGEGGRAARERPRGQRRGGGARFASPRLVTEYLRPKSSPIGSTALSL